MDIQPRNMIEIPAKQDVAVLRDLSPELRKVGRLCDNVFLLVAQFPKSVDQEEELKARATVDEQVIPLQTQGMPLLQDGSDNGNFLAWLSIPSEIASGVHRIEVSRGTSSISIPPSVFRLSSNGLQSLILDHLAGREADERSRLVDFLASATETDSTHPDSLSRALLQARESLRERFPRSQMANHLPQGLHIDSLMKVDDKSFYVRGWLRDQNTSIRCLNVISPEGCCAELLPNIFSYPRPDVDQLYGVTQKGSRTSRGFIAFFELESPSRLPDNWIFQMQNRWGEAMEAKASIREMSREAVRETLLRDIIHSPPPQQRFLLNHIHPAISRLQELDQAGVEVKSVQNYGDFPRDPEVSIIIPLYGRIDLLELQFAQFFRDSEVRQADLVYVLDSPELARELEELAPQLFEVYRVPFRVVTLERNSGFSVANNVGASFARGRLLLFMNSDVFPSRNGWLGTLCRYYESTPGIGALGPKLLYEDDSLQHAGIYFRKATGSPLWENMHYFKGLHRNLEAANLTRQVPAVTGACLLISQKLYRRIGGFRGIYVKGDFEDTDLCLRLIELGRQNRYLPKVELYHLEAQSYPSSLRQLCYGYNSWLHSHFWSDAIESLMLDAADSDAQVKRLAIQVRRRKGKLHERY